VQVGYLKQTPYLQSGGEGGGARPPMCAGGCGSDANSDVKWVAGRADGRRWLAARCHTLLTTGAAKSNGPIRRDRW